MSTLGIVDLSDDDRVVHFTVNRYADVVYFTPPSSSQPLRYPIIGFGTTQNGNVIAMTVIEEDGRLIPVPELITELERQHGQGHVHLAWKSRP